MKKGEEMKEKDGVKKVQVDKRTRQKHHWKNKQKCWTRGQMDRWTKDQDSNSNGPTDKGNEHGRKGAKVERENHSGKQKTMQKIEEEKGRKRQR